MRRDVTVCQARPQTRTARAATCDEFVNRVAAHVATDDGWAATEEEDEKKKSLSENHIYVRAPPSAESIPFPRHSIEPRNNHLRHFYKCSNNMFVIFRLSVRLTFMFSLFHIFNADIKVL